MLTARRGAPATDDVAKLTRLEHELSDYAPKHIPRFPSRFLRFLAIITFAVILGALAAILPSLTTRRPAASSVDPLAEERSTLQRDLAAAETARRELSN